MKGFILALQFFTRIPINIQIDFTKKNIKSAFYFLPLPGGAIAACTLLPRLFLPAFRGTASAPGVLIYACITGGLHLDGLADTADVFFGKTKRKNPCNYASLRKRHLRYHRRLYQPITAVHPLCRNYLLRTDNIGRHHLPPVRNHGSSFCKTCTSNRAGSTFSSIGGKIKLFFRLTAVCILSLFSAELTHLALRLQSLSKVQHLFTAGRIKN